MSIAGAGNRCISERTEIRERAVGCLVLILAISACNEPGAAAETEDCRTRKPRTSSHTLVILWREVFSIYRFPDFNDYVTLQLSTGAEGQTIGEEHTFSIRPLSGESEASGICVARIEGSLPNYEDYESEVVDTVLLFMEGDELHLLSLVSREYASYSRSAT